MRRTRRLHPQWSQKRLSRSASFAVAPPEVARERPAVPHERPLGTADGAASAAVVPPVADRTEVEEEPEPGVVAQACHLRLLSPRAGRDGHHEVRPRPRAGRRRGAGSEGPAR